MPVLIERNNKPIVINGQEYVIQQNQRLDIELFDRFQGIIDFQEYHNDFMNRIWSYYSDGEYPRIYRYRHFETAVEEIETFISFRIDSDSTPKKITSKFVRIYNSIMKKTKETFLSFRIIPDFEKLVNKYCIEQAMMKFISSAVGGNEIEMFNLLKMDLYYEKKQVIKPKFTYKDNLLKQMMIKYEKPDCSVCFEKLTIKDKLFECGHMCCNNCHKSLIVLKCPECRAEIDR